MDPHPTPYAGKRRSVAATAKVAAPKPKSIAATRTKTTRKSPPALPQPRPRRAFGTVRSSNAPPPEKPPPMQKAPKVSQPPPQKAVKVSPPPPQKPSKVSPPPPQKSAKVSPPPVPKPSKLSPPNLAKAATKPPRQAAKPLKKAAPGVELDPKPKKKSQRVTFQEDAVTVTVVAPASGEKVKVSMEDSAGRTPMVSMKALEKKVKDVSEETPFFTAQNCSNCTLNPLEESTYWLAHIRLAEEVGDHRVAAAFFQLAFECQAQPIHRIQSELRNYTVRHESASILTSLFDELLVAHGGMPVNQPKFDTDGFEVVDTPLTTNGDDKRLDSTTTQVDEKCLEGDCGGAIVDVGHVAVSNIVKPLEEGVDRPSFEKKLDDSFEFDNCEAVIVDRLVLGHSDLEKIDDVNGPCDNETVKSACRSSIDKLILEGSPAVSGLSQRMLSSDSPLDKLSPFARSLSAKRLSSVSPLDKKSPFGSSSSKRLTSSCPSFKKSFSSKACSSKRISSGCNHDGEHNASAGAGDLNEVILDVEFDCSASADQLEPKEHKDDAAVNEIN